MDGIRALFTSLICIYYVFFDWHKYIILFVLRPARLLIICFSSVRKLKGNTSHIWHPKTSAFLSGVPPFALASHVFTWPQKKEAETSLMFAWAFMLKCMALKTKYGAKDRQDLAITLHLKMWSNEFSGGKLRSVFNCQDRFGWEMTDIPPLLTRAELTSQIYSITRPRADQKMWHVEGKDALWSWWCSCKVTFPLSRQIIDCTVTQAQTRAYKHPGF